MYIYKVNKESEKGKVLTALLSNAREADDAAVDLVVSFGADGYVPDESVDFGGVWAVTFPKTTLISSKTWRAIKSASDGAMLYEPIVKVKTEFLPSEEAEKRKGNPSCIVSQTELEWSNMPGVFSREKSAEMAGIKLTTPSLERLMKKHGFTRKEFVMLSMGQPSQLVLKDYGHNVIMEVAKTQDEDSQINDTMKGRKFRLVETVEGTYIAVDFYKKSRALPVVPSGLTNNLCKVDDNVHRCGLTDYDDYIYISCEVESTCDAFEKVSDVEFQQICAIKDAEAKERKEQKNKSVTDKCLN